MAILHAHIALVYAIRLNGRLRVSPKLRRRGLGFRRSLGEEVWGFDVLESIAADLERLRLLREHEIGVRVVTDEEGNLLLRPVGEG